MAVKSSKICPNCNSKSVIRKGKRNNIQRYKCNVCSHWFNSQRRPEQLQKIIFQEYFLQRQTLQQLSLKYNRSIPWIRKQILEYQEQ